MLRTPKFLFLIACLASLGWFIGPQLEEQIQPNKPVVFEGVDRFVVSREASLIALDVRGEEKNHVALLSSKNGKVKRKALSPALDTATHSIRFSGNGKLVALRWLKEVRVYTVRGKLVATFETPEQFSGMELNDKGTRLATMVRGSNLIEVFEIKSGESLGRVKAPKHGPFFLNPKGDIVLFSADSSLFLYHLKNEKLKEVHTKMKLQNMKLIDRGKLLVIADDQGRIEFRKTSNGKRVGKPLHHASPAWVASHSKKARLVATRCNNGGAKLTSHLWDRKKAKVVEDFVGIGPTFSQDDRVFAYTEQDRKGYHTLVAKELSDGQELFRIKPEKGKRQPFLITIHNSKKSLGIWTSDFGKNGWENVRFRKVPRPQKEQ